MDRLAQLAQARSPPVAHGAPPKLGRSLSEKSWEALSECSDSTWQILSDDTWQEVGSTATLEAPEAGLSGEPVLDIEEAKLKLAEANQACDCLSLSNVRELKSLTKPPAGIDVVCCTVGLLLGFGARVKDWSGCQKMMCNPQAFLLALKVFDAKRIPTGSLRKVRVIMHEPFFNHDSMRMKSYAAASLVTWVINIVEYNLLHSKIASQQGAIKADLVVDDGAQVPSTEEVQAEEVITLLDAANDALHSLSKGDIAEVKAFKNPPRAVALTMEAVCILFGLRPVRKIDPQNPHKFVLDYWQTSRKLLDDVTLSAQMLEFDRDNIPSEVIVKLAPYIARADFAPDEIKKASCACAGICKWVHAVYKYRVAKEAGDKAAREANSEQTEAPADARGLAAEKPKPDKAEPMAESDSLCDAANEALGKVTKGALGELKCFAAPPLGVLMTMQSVGILLGLDEASNWDTAKKLLADAGLIHKLQTFDKDNIPSGAIMNIAPLVARADFAPEVIKKVSVACEHLCAWVHAVFRYHIAKGAVANGAMAADGEHKETSANDEPPAMESPRKEPSPPSPHSGSTWPPSPDAAAWLSSGSALSSPTSPQCPASVPSAIQFGGLDKRDLVELKAMANPPEPVMIVCACVAVLRPLGKAEPDSGWKGAKAMLSDPCLLKSMQEYRRESASEEQLRRVRELLEIHQCLQGESLKAVSKAAYGLLEWVRAVLEDVPLAPRTLCWKAPARRPPPGAARWALLVGEAHGPHVGPWRPC